MNWKKYLEDANTEYYRSDEINKPQLLENIKKIHLSLLRNPEELGEFIEFTMQNIGSIYLPYLFWIEVAKLLDKRHNPELIYQMIEAFCNSDFEEEERNKMKPLLIIYFAMENEFHIDRIKSFIIQKSHKTVQDYFSLIFKFVHHNKRAVEVLIKKMQMLKKYYPSFELLELPVQELEEKLGKPKTS
ncbi:MAG: hypothetical protein RML72_12420 [Bacteroidia bacterium]|nr:hypothetical protein [Bacteroidia bacterium]